MTILQVNKRVSMLPHPQSSNGVSDEGFVLPYVLVVIAILAITTTIAVQRISKVSDIVGAFQSQAAAELVFASAEADIIFTYLTAVPAPGGLDMTVRATSEFSDVDFLSTQSSQDPDSLDIWQGTRTARAIDTPSGAVIVQYQDTSGLVPLNMVAPGYVENYLKYKGFSSPDARKLAAKLGDYKDRDNSRRSNGGERSAYRLRGLPAPTNSPLRDFSELPLVLDWTDALEDIDPIQFRRDTTASPYTSAMKVFYTPDHLKVPLGLSQRMLAGEGNAGLGVDGVEQSVIRDTFPSSTGRFIITYALPDGTFLQRAVEVERAVGALGVPFRKNWVFDTSVIDESTAAEFQSFNELDNVVNAPSSFPK